MGQTGNETIGIILLNLGGPDSLQAVRPFLYNLFSDRNIIRLGPSFMQKPLAYLISTLRSKKTEKMYSLIGGKSPIVDITTSQAEALESTLNSEFRIQNSELPFKVYVAMRYWYPFTEEVVSDIYKKGIKRIVALSLYPHYSMTTTGSSFLKLKEVLKDYPLETSYISQWFNHPLYIEALVDLIKEGMELFTPSLTSERIDSDFPPRGGVRGGGDIHVLFSAHSLPQKFIEQGDPYVDHINGTISEIAKLLPVPWHLSYQSKTGPVKWLEPSTEDKLKELARDGVRNILVVPISFVSDHIETLYEIDVLYKSMAQELGVSLKRVNSLNIHPVFIKALADMVIKNAKKEGWF
jgi:ferrochelatase